MSTYTVETIVCGYHVYRAVWETAVGQVLPSVPAGTWYLLYLFVGGSNNGRRDNGRQAIFRLW